MVKDDLEHDFGDFAGIRFWMWIFLSGQMFFNAMWERNVGLMNWFNFFFACLLGAHLRAIAEDLSDNIWRHFRNKAEENRNADPQAAAACVERATTKHSEATAASAGKGKSHGVDYHVFKEEVEIVNRDLSDRLENIEPKFLLNRPRLLLLWFQLVMWNSSGTLVQSAWYSASGLGCYYAVRPSFVLPLAIAVALTTLLHIGSVVLPLYALALHCGEHLRPKTKGHRKRTENKEKLHRAQSFKTITRGLIQGLREQGFVGSKGMTAIAENGGTKEETSATGPQAGTAAAKVTPSSASNKYVVEVTEDTNNKEE